MASDRVPVEFVKGINGLDNVVLREVRGSSVECIKSRDANLASKVGNPNVAKGKQAIKRQKLEGGKSKQMFVREPAFVSMAEMMRKFQSNTREMNLPSTSRSISHLDADSGIKRKPKLTLTRPKEPDLETAQRVHSVKIKSSAELEEEMMAKIPKFKARPLNKKIFECKGGLGMFCATKRQVTIPQEFNFATDDRIPPPPTNVAKLFEKLSLSSESNHRKKQLPRRTAPNPFQLRTEERGAEKEMKFVTKVVQKQLEEERGRIPKATGYPYTTDYPEPPPKPEPKPSTKPEPFQLESLVRHEEEMKREMEERRRLEDEEARLRIFRAQPILREDPIPVPEKVCRPLTEIQQFDLHVEHRAVDRLEFEKKIKEKEMMYKRYQDEAESAKRMEEEKALKQLRRTLVHHARPVPNFNHPFLPQKSSQMIGAAASSPASNMR